MSNNLHEGIKIFIVCVSVLALNTMVTLQLKSRLHLPASSQTPAGSWQSPYGFTVFESNQGAEPRLQLRLSPAARSSSSPWWAKMTSLPAGQAQVSSDGHYSFHSHQMAPVTAGVWSTRGSSTQSSALDMQPMIYKLSLYYCSPNM